MIVLFSITRRGGDILFLSFYTRKHVRTKGDRAANSHHAREVGRDGKRERGNQSSPLLYTCRKEGSELAEER